MVKRGPQKVKRIIVSCKLCGIDVATVKRHPAKHCLRCRKKLQNQRYQKTTNYREAIAKYRRSEKYQKWLVVNWPVNRKGELKNG